MCLCNKTIKFISYQINVDNTITITCSKSIIKSLEKGVKYVQG